MMTPIESWPLEKITIRCEELISHLGMTLQAGTDFEVFKFLAGNSQREIPLDPIFDPVTSDIDNVRGIWLIGRNAAGEIVQTQAVRMLDLQSQTLAEFFACNIEQIRPIGEAIDLKKTRWRLSPNASGIRGDVCYHGGLWIRKDFRGGCLAALLTRYLMAKAVLELMPDYLIGLQAPVTGCRGLSAREGYMHLEQKTILWFFKDSTQPVEDWMVWMNQEEARFNLGISPDEFYLMFEREPVPMLKSA